MTRIQWCRRETERSELIIGAARTALSKGCERTALYNTCEHDQTKSAAMRACEWGDGVMPSTGPDGRSSAGTIPLDVWNCNDPGMRADLNAFDFDLDAGDVGQIEGLNIA